MKSIALSVARKELLESFRDRQFVLYGVALPLAMYPVMFWVMIQASLIVDGLGESTAVRVELAEGRHGAVPAILERTLAAEDDAVARIEVERGAGYGRDTAAERLDPDRAGHEGRDVVDHADAVLWFEAPGEPAELLYDSTEGRSQLARERLAARLPELAWSLREEAAGERGVAPESLRPVAIEEHNLAPEESMGSYMLSFILPMMLVIMTVMGAFFPAVDLTAGENERGTNETTLLLPVPRTSVHRGKILAVCATACLAASLNLLAMGLSAGHVLSMLAAGAEIRIELPVGAFLAVAPLAVLFALFVSTVLTSLASLTKTFKEGQALLGPVQVLFFAPAVVCAVPGLQLTPALALVPIVNVVLAFKALLRGEAPPLELALCAVSLVVAALLGSWFALRLLSRESVQVASGGSLRRVLSLLRSGSGSR